MNLTIFKLVSSSFSYSPFITNHISNQFQTQLISNSYFHNYITNFFYGHYSSIQTNFFKSNLFSNFLHSPIHISNSLYDGIALFMDYFNKKNIIIKNIKNKWHVDSYFNTLFITCCSFSSCKSHDGGAINSYGCNVTIYYCQFIKNRAKNSGAVSISDSPNGTILNSLFYMNSAKRFGSMHLDGHDNSNDANIHGCNFSHNSANLWIGCLRIQHNHGTISKSIFFSSKSEEYGTIFDYSHYPGTRVWSHDIIMNNSAKIAAGLTIYHLNHNGSLEYCIFQKNVNTDEKRGTSIYIHSDNDHLTLKNCYFDGSRQTELFVFFTDTSSIHVDDSCSFEKIINTNIN